MIRKEKPVIHAHYFREIGAVDACEIKFCAPTAAEAMQNLSQAERYEHVRSEELPYKYTDIALAIAAALGSDWSAIPQSDEYADCNWYLARKDGLKLWLSGPSYSHRDKFNVSLSQPTPKGQYSSIEVYEVGSWSRVAIPSIGVSDKKTPDQIAKDIARRLLPEAERVHGLYLAEIDKRAKAADARVESLKQVAAALGKVAMQYNNGSWHFNVSFEGGTAEVQEGGSVTFKLYSLDRAKAVKLAKALNKSIF